jgi:hypothetical protein
VDSDSKSELSRTKLNIKSAGVLWLKPYFLVWRSTSIEELETIAMKVLLGGIIGAAASVAAWLGLDHVTQLDLSWLVCSVGVITGYCVHCAAGPRSGGSFVRGGLSVLLALVAIVGGRLAYAKVMEANTGQAAAVTVAKQSGGDEAQVEEVQDVEARKVETQEVETQEETEETTEESTATSQRSAMVDDRSVAPVGMGPIATPSRKLTFSQFDMLWMSLAALAAYIIGKGRDEVQTTAAAKEPQSEPQSPSANGP